MLHYSAPTIENSEFDSTVIQPTGMLYPPNCWYWLICTRKFSSIPTCHWKWSHKEFSLCTNHKSSSTWWERVAFLRVFQSSSNYYDSHCDMCILHTKFKNHLFSINLFVVTTYLSSDYLGSKNTNQNFTRLPPLSNTNLNEWLVSLSLIPWILFSNLSRTCSCNFLISLAFFSASAIYCWVLGDGVKSSGLRGRMP